MSPALYAICFDEHERKAILFDDCSQWQTGRLVRMPGNIAKRAGIEAWRVESLPERRANSHASWRVASVKKKASRDPAERPHRPVDVLFYSLAEQRGSNAIGIILSGAGSDGAKGIQAIKQAGGITFAQDESSARFFGMPSSAIQTGCVDFIQKPGEIAQELISISRHP